jgi:hypothetical protein
MKQFAAALAAIFCIATVSAAYSQSLADLAAKEKLRREAIKKSAKVITNEQTVKYSGATVTTNDPASPPTSESDSEKKEDKAETVQSQAGKPESDEPVDFEGRPESFWRKAMAEARQKVKELENETNVLTLKQNDLQMQFYREDNGFKREGIQREIQKTYYEQDLNKENLAKAKSALKDLENEARKSGALPGWLTSQNP